MAVSIRGDKSICLPVESEEEYRQLINDNSNFRAYLSQLYAQYPEIFPSAMDKNSARLYLRSMALIWNFHPYGTRTRSQYSTRISPFSDLNGFSYHDNWLHNLLIASSMNGRQTLQSD